MSYSVVHYVSRSRGKSTVQDLKLAAEVCLPLINAVLIELKNKTYPEGSFLNIDIPTDVAHHKVTLNIWPFSA